MVRVIDTIASDQQLQSHWIYRIVAIIIDWIIILIAVWIISIPIAIGSFLSGRGMLWGFGSLFTFAIWFLYVFILEGIKGKTIGKHLLNLRVVTIDGGPIDIAKSIIRNISKIHGILLFLDWLAGMATDGDPRQRFLDRIAGTVVIRMDTQENFQGAYPPPPMAKPYVSHRRPPHPPPRRPR